MIYLSLIIPIVVSYLIGSIPVGLLLTRAAGFGDVRQIGSGNIGATNVLRTGSKSLAMLTLLLDLLKGFVAVELMALPNFGFQILFTLLAGLFVVIGHMYPYWLNFKGGKGVATALGVIIAYSPVLGTLIALTWLSMVVVFRYSSLAAIVSAIMVPIFGYFILSQEYVLVITIISVLVLFRHRDNIRRLIKGEESKINLTKA
jgi:glycerol-3-phosphate acyltransferase PlsY